MNKELALSEVPHAEFAHVESINEVNFKPHPFVIGVKHVVHASDHHSGMLGDATINAIPCDQCNRPRSEHTFDRVAFVVLDRDLTKTELQAWLLSFGEEWCKKHEIDGFGFIKTSYELKDE